jgi:hypothetical protein
MRSSSLVSARGSPLCTMVHQHACGFQCNIEDSKFRYNSALDRCKTFKTSINTVGQNEDSIESMGRNNQQELEQLDLRLAVRCKRHSRMWPPCGARVLLNR